MREGKAGCKAIAGQTSRTTPLAAKLKQFTGRCGKAGGRMSGLAVISPGPSLIDDMPREPQWQARRSIYRTRTSHPVSACSRIPLRREAIGQRRGARCPANERKEDPMDPSEKQAAHRGEKNTDFSDLRAVFFNCTLKHPDQASHTSLLMGSSARIMRKSGVAVDEIRMTAHDIAFGVQPDMREHGWDRDDWPDLWPKVKAADILVVGTPIWLGEQSSVCRLLIERLYAMSGMLNDKGQSIFYGKTGGVVVTGNEDGIKHVAMNVLYSLSHLGYAIPPQADCGWIGEAGPGPSYGDDGAGLDNEFTQRNTTIMTWNLLHMARMLKDAGGIPSHGNDRKAWSAGCRFDYEKPQPG
ncbi:flavodoxin family protein [Paracoccus sp. UBA5162]|uniref:flavodoxin family protein n=2 Tax=unclassified Paracoccus (in: a-proteobacteria) TaxID=2688777 RepID=UPI0032E4B39F